MASRMASPVMVGRGRERRLLTDALTQATLGVPSTILVGGEAGIGKSRLLADMGATAREGGLVVLTGSCVRLSETNSLPFAPVTEALRSLRRELGATVVEGLMDAATSELASLVPELGRPDERTAPSGRPDWAQTRIFEGLLTLLGRLGERQPAVLVMEDLHWADQSTRDILAFLSRNLRAERVALVASFRSDELHRRHPLRPWLAEMERSSNVARIDLSRLTPEDVRLQVAAILEDEPDPSLIEVILRRSGGNPFFAEELLAAGVSASNDRLPETLRELLLVRVHALPETTQDVLGCGATAGLSFEHDLLLEAVDLDERTVSTALKDAVSAQVVQVDDTGGTYVFRHALLQEAIYDDLLPGERRRIHARFADALRARPVPDGALGASLSAALAHHATAAHALPLALAGWVDAARASSAVWALAEAANAYDRALDLWDAVPADDRPAGVDVVDLFYEASLVLIGVGELRRAHDLAAQAVDRYPADGDPLRAANLRERLARTLWLNGELTLALESLESAVELTRVGPGTPESARVTASLAGILVLKDHTTRAVELGREAVAQAQAVGAPHVEAYAMCGLGVALVNRGECDEGLQLLRDAVARAHALGLSAIDFHRTYANLSSGLQICGDLEGSIAVALEGVEWARSRGLWRLQGAFLEANAAAALLELGRWEEAQELLHQRRRPITEGVAFLNQALVSGPLFVRTGRFDEARVVLDHAHDRLAGLGDAQFTGPVMVGLTELAIEEGRFADASRLADEGMERLAGTEETGTRYRAELLALALSAEAQALSAARPERNQAAMDLIHGTAAKRIVALREVGEGPLGPMGGWGSETLAYIRMGEADWSSIDDRPDPVAWVAAADAWEALGRPFHRARCLARQAEAILASRRARLDATGPLVEAYRIARGVGAVPLAEWCERIARMARLTLPDYPADGDGAGDDDGDRHRVPRFGLTARELDVLRLLVDGYSNRQIGETLYVSESTAGVHVSNILGKLGVSGRVEAAAVAVRAGLVD